MTIKSTSYKIGKVAKLAKVSVRTLHHYDAIGLLTATGRSDSGYRLYTQGDLERLQQILFYKTLEFSLEEIRQLMLSPTFNRSEALLQQRKLMQNKSNQLHAVLKLINKTIAQMAEDKQMKAEEMFEVFPDTTQEQLDEAESRWGETEQYKESTHRFSKYTKNDLLRMKDELSEINDGIIETMTANIPANGRRAKEAVNRHRLHIDKWHYPCSWENYLSLARMYVSDERFREHYEKLCPGMAEYILEASNACL